MDVLLRVFTEGLGKILDTHVLLVEKTITERRRVAWVDAPAQKLKHEKNRAERRWLRCSSNEGWLHQKEMKALYKKHLFMCKANFINNVIMECGRDTGRMFQTIKNLSGTEVQRMNSLPDGKSDLDLANEYADFSTIKLRRSEMISRQRTHTNHLQESVANRAILIR